MEIDHVFVRRQMKGLLVEGRTRARGRRRAVADRAGAPVDAHQVDAIDERHGEARAARLVLPHDRAEPRTTARCPGGTLVKPPPTTETSRGPPAARRPPARREHAAEPAAAHPADDPAHVAGQLRRPGADPVRRSEPTISAPKTKAAIVFGTTSRSAPLGLADVVPTAARRVGRKSRSKSRPAAKATAMIAPR